MILRTEKMLPVNDFAKVKYLYGQLCRCFEFVHFNKFNYGWNNVKFSNLYKIIGNQYVSLKYLKIYPTGNMKKYAFSDKKRQNLQRFSEPVSTGNNNLRRAKEEVLKIQRRFRLIAPVAAVREKQKIELLPKKP